MTDLTILQSSNGKPRRGVPSSPPRELSQLARKGDQPGREGYRQHVSLGKRGSWCTVQQSRDPETRSGPRSHPPPYPSQVRVADSWGQGRLSGRSPTGRMGLSKSLCPHPPPSPSLPVQGQQRPSSGSLLLPTGLRVSPPLGTVYAHTQARGPASSRAVWGPNPQPSVHHPQGHPLCQAQGWGLEKQPGQRRTLRLLAGSVSGVHSPKQVIQV